MVKEKKQTNAVMWKSLVGITIAFALVKILHRWLSEATAWALAGFVLAMLLHLLPPRSPLTLGKVLLLAAATAIVLFALTKLIG